MAHYHSNLCDLCSAPATDMVVFRDTLTGLASAQICRACYRMAKGADLLEDILEGIALICPDQNSTNIVQNNLTTAIGSDSIAQ